MVFAAAHKRETGKVSISLEELARMFTHMIDCGRNLARIEGEKKRSRSAKKR